MQNSSELPSVPEIVSATFFCRLCAKLVNCWNFETIIVNLLARELTGTLDKFSSRREGLPSWSWDYETFFLFILFLVLKMRNFRHREPRKAGLSLLFFKLNKRSYQPRGACIPLDSARYFLCAHVAHGTAKSWTERENRGGEGTTDLLPLKRTLSSPVIFPPAISRQFLARLARRKQRKRREPAIRTGLAVCRSYARRGHR